MDTQNSIIPSLGTTLQSAAKTSTNTIANADQNPFLNQRKDDANDIQKTLATREAWNRPSPQALQEFEAKLEDLQCGDAYRQETAKTWIRNLDESYKVKIIQLVRLGLEYMPLVYSDRPTFTQEGEYNKMVKPLEIMEAFIPLLHPDLLESVVKELLSMQQSSAYSLQQREAMLSLALLVMEGEEFTHTHNNIKKELDSLLAVLLGLIDLRHIGPKSLYNYIVNHIHKMSVGTAITFIKNISDESTLLTYIKNIFNESS